MGLRRCGRCHVLRHACPFGATRLRVACCVLRWGAAAKLCMVGGALRSNNGMEGYRRLPWP